MSVWLDKQKKSNGSFRKLLQERIDKANPRCKLTTEESKRLGKLEDIADKLDMVKTYNIVSYKLG